MPRKARPIENRFWEKVRQGEGCWEWLGRRDRGGYGVFWLNRDTPVGAHRISWELVNGPIPRGMRICHRCDNPPCVNPDHLFSGTARDNTHDAMRKGRLVPPPRTVQRGGRNSMAKLSAQDVSEMREMHSSGSHSYSQLAELYGVGYQAAYSAVTGRNWKHVPVASRNPRIEITAEAA